MRKPEMRPAHFYKLFSSSALCLLLSLFLVLPTAGSTISQADPDSPIESVAKSIMKDELLLARHNLQYRLNATKQGRWKGVRYFLFQEANNALTTSGLIVGVSERMTHIRGDEYKRLHTGALMHGNVLGGVGQTIAAGGSILEFLINGYHSVDEFNRGFSPGKAKAYTVKLVEKIDQSLDEFNRIAQQEITSGKTSVGEVHAKEAKVLADIRDVLVAEFDGFHVNAVRSLWYQQSFYLLDVAKNVTGAVGNLYGYKALRQRHRLFNREASVLSTISGALIAADPILSRLIGKTMGSVDGYLLKKSGLLKVENALTNLKTDSAELKTACDRYKEEGTTALMSSLTRLDMYSAHDQRFDKQVAMRQKEIRTNNRVAVQNVLSGLFIGSTKIANGVEFLVAGYKYHEDARMTNVMIGTGSIPYLAGSSFGLLDNLRILVQREVGQYKLGQKHQLSGQLIKQQLEGLDALEKSIDQL